MVFVSNSLLINYSNNVRYTQVVHAVIMPHVLNINELNNDDDFSIGILP